MAKLLLGTLIGIIVPQILRIPGRLTLSVGWLWSQHCCAPLEVFSLILYSLQLLETFGITSTTKQTNILTLVMVIANQQKKILRWCNKSPKFVTHTGKNVAVDHNWDYCSTNSSTRYTSCGDLNIPRHLGFLIFYTLQPLDTVGIT